MRRGSTGSVRYRRGDDAAGQALGVNHRSKGTANTLDALKSSRAA